jgi:hypothetical protein
VAIEKVESVRSNQKGNVRKVAIKGVRHELLEDKMRNRKAHMAVGITGEFLQWDAGGLV